MKFARNIVVKGLTNTPIFPLIRERSIMLNQIYGLFIHVCIVDLITILWWTVGGDNPCRRSYLGRRHKEKVVFQSRKMTIKDWSFTTWARIVVFIVVRKAIKGRSVGIFFHNFVWNRTEKERHLVQRLHLQQWMMLFQGLKVSFLFLALIS